MSSALNMLFDGWLVTAAVDLALLFGLLLAVDLLLGERLGPRVRYLLWSLLLVRMLLPTLLPDPLGWKNAPPPSPALHSVPAATAESALPSPPAPRPRERTRTRDVSALSETSLLQEREEMPARNATRPAAVPLTEAGSDSPPQAISASSNGGRTVLLAWLWAAGAALLLLRLATLEFRFRRALRRSARPAPASVQQTLDAARSRLGLRRAVVAVVTEAVPAPAVYGVLRPRLLLPPTTLARLSDTELAHVVGHEVAHLRAGDTLLCWLLAIARALHWYHPAAWIGLRRLQAAQEVLRDYQALGTEPGVDPGGYAATLLKLGAPPPTRPQPAPLPAIIEDGKDLKRRIQMIIDFPSRRRGATLLGSCLLAAVGWVGLTTAASVTGPDDDGLQQAQYKSVRVVRQEPVPEWKTELLARLQKPVDIDVDAASLEDVLDVLREKAGVNVVVDQDAMDMADSVDLQVSGRTAAQVLDLICGEGLDWGLAPGVVMIGWEYDDLQRHDLRFYAVEELILGEDPEWRAERLQELLSELSWRDWETEYASMRYWNGLLIVRQTDRGHERVASLLDMLLNRGRHAPTSVPEWQAELDTKLDVITAVDFDEQGLAAVVRALSEQTEVPMYVHPDVAMDQMVTLRLDGLPLRDVLDWIGRQTWTHAVVDDGMVRFVDEPPTEIRMYDIADLLRLQGADSEEAADQVMELVQDGTGWAAWEIEDARLEIWDGMLVVVQSADTHTRVARFLEALREAL